MKGKKRPDCDIDLGLAVSSLSLEYGHTRTYEELAAFCGCSKTAIQSIENKAIRKIRKSLYCDSDMNELLDQYRVLR